MRSWLLLPVNCFGKTLGILLQLDRSIDKVDYSPAFSAEVSLFPELCSTSRAFHFLFRTRQPCAGDVFKRTRYKAIFVESCRDYRAQQRPVHLLTARCSAEVNFSGKMTLNARFR